MAARTYTVRYERDAESGWWIAEVPEVQGCRTQGRTINEARRRIREALDLYVDDAATAKLKDDVHLPPAARRALKRLHAAKSKADLAQQDAAATAEETARVLTRDVGLSVRDAGELLGLSHQRVHQLRGG